MDENFTQLKINETDLADISTTIPKSIREYIKEKNYKYNELIRLGVLAKEDNPQLISRIRETEDKTELIKRYLIQIRKDIQELQTKLDIVIKTKSI